MKRNYKGDIVLIFAIVSVLYIITTAVGGWFVYQKITKNNEEDVIGKENDIKKEDLGNNEGCTGGTTDDIIYLIGEKKEFSARVYHCGGEKYGDLDGDISAFISDIKPLIPNLSSQLY